MAAAAAGAEEVGITGSVARVCQCWAAVGVDVSGCFEFLTHIGNSLGQRNNTTNICKSAEISFFDMSAPTFLKKKSLKFYEASKRNVLLDSWSI
jgi:hypothetical protein